MLYLKFKVIRRNHNMMTAKLNNNARLHLIVVGIYSVSHSALGHQ